MTSAEWIALVKYLIAVAVICGLFFGIGCLGDIQRKRGRE